MGEEPTNRLEGKEVLEKSLQLLPENASAVDAPSHSPSLFREILKKFNRTFWSWWGIPEIADDIETHGTATKKAAVVIFLLILTLIVFFAAFGVKGWLGSGELEATKEDLAKSQGATLEAERDRDKYQVLYNNDENALGPVNTN